MANRWRRLRQKDKGRRAGKKIRKIFVVSCSDSYASVLGQNQDHGMKRVEVVRLEELYEIEM